MTSKRFDFGFGPTPSHRHENGGGWVANTAFVSNAAFVGPDAHVFEEAFLCSGVRIEGKARVYGNAFLGGNAKVKDNASVCGHAFVVGMVEISGDSFVGGDANIGGNAWILSGVHLGSKSPKLCHACGKGNYVRTFGQNRYVEYKGVRVEIPSDISLTQCNNCSEILFSPTDMETLEPYMNAIDQNPFLIWKNSRTQK